MTSAHARGHESWSPPMSPATPIVFVVDDDISVRESLELLIRCEGWQPQTFASAQEFLDRPRVLVPSCLVLDVSLPGLNGLDLQNRIAAERTDMPIIFITGHGDVPMTVQAMKAGAEEFLTKPFGDDVLLGAMRHALKLWHVLDSKAEYLGAIVRMALNLGMRKGKLFLGLQLQNTRIIAKSKGARSGPREPRTARPSIMPI